MSALDTQMTAVPYKGTGPAMVDLLGGQIDLICDQATTTLGHITSGKVKAYAVTTKSRVPVLPDLPTLDEAGLKGFDRTAAYVTAIVEKPRTISTSWRTGVSLWFAKRWPATADDARKDSAKAV